MKDKAGKLLHDLKVSICGEIVADLGRIPSDPNVMRTFGQFADTPEGDAMFKFNGMFL